MFRDMRRKKQELSHEESLTILDRATSGVLAVVGDNGYPYAVPLSHVREGDRLFFHSALSGHKVDAIGSGCKASFCVVDKDTVVPEKYTTFFRSAIAFGTARILTDDGERKHALEVLAAKFSPDDEPGRLAEIESLFDRTCMIELALEHVSGKEAIELVRERSADRP